MNVYRWLFAAFVLLGFMYPVQEMGAIGIWLWVAVFWLSLLLTVRVCAQRHRDRLVARALFVVVLSLGVASQIGWETGQAWSAPLDIALGCVQLAFFAWTARVIAFDVMTGVRVDINQLFGATCLYILIALAWATAFQLASSVSSGPAFYWNGEPMDEHGIAAYHDFLYLSFSTISTLGYGDVIPVTSWARFLACAEAIVGQLYLTVLVARLVGLSISQRDGKIISENRSESV